MSDTVSGGVRDVGVERSEVTRIPSLCQDSLSLPVIHSVLSPPFINSDSVLAPSGTVWLGFPLGLSSSRFTLSIPPGGPRRRREGAVPFGPGPLSPTGKERKGM